MEKLFGRAMRKCSIIPVAVAVLANGAFAATHTVQFGGSLGLVYSPSSFNAIVGDTVKWQGDFSMHPLSSTTIPAGAASWHQGSGSSFTYKISVAGTYHYQCDVHVSVGMVGSFTASASTVEQQLNTGFSHGSREIALSVTEKDRAFLVKLETARSQPVSVRVFDFSGRMAAVLVDGTVSAGSHAFPLAAGTLSRGYYFIEVNGAGVRRVISFFKAQ